MVANTDRDWVAFDEGGKGSFKAEDGGQKKKNSSRNKPQIQRAVSMPTSVRDKPVQTENTATPPPPPVSVGFNSHQRLPSKKHPISPKYALQPVKPSRNRVGGIESEGGNSSSSDTKPERLSVRTQTCSTSGSSSGDDEKRNKKWLKQQPKLSGGAQTTVESGAGLAAPRPRRQSASIGGNNKRGSGGSKSATSKPPATSRGRPTSRGSHATAKPPATVSKRARSTSRSSRASQGRERSGSGTRPPATRNNSSKSSGSHRRRSRSRSDSVTRVTGPNTTTAGSASASGTPKHRPPSTSRTRHELKKRTGGGSSSSIGPGITPRSCPSDEFDEHDDNIGRDISFGLDDNMSNQGSKSLHKDETSMTKLNCRKPGIMEKLFGDQVDKPSNAGAPGNLNYELRSRILLAATVYHNTATSLWITTINTNQRGVARDPVTANRYLKAFSFSTEFEARESAIANAPPKMVPFEESPGCFVCSGKFALFRRASHCRNCGVCVCSTCSTSWPAKMIPETYNLKKEANVKICLSCNSLSLAFKKALLEGDYEEAVALYGTGNVNLRTPFPVANKKDEVMYPIHCAVEGGNIDAVRWLIDDHFCPIKLIRTGSGKKSRSGADVPILTSKGRSLLSIAIDRVKVDIMRYLVIECGVSIYESTELKSSLRALEAALIALPSTVGNRSGPKEELPLSTRWDNASFDDISEPSSLGVDEPLLLDDRVSVGSRKSSRTKNSRKDDSCIICFERKIDCCAMPCGHQICCLECSGNLSACPVCTGVSVNNFEANIVSIQMNP